MANSRRPRTVATFGLAQASILPKGGLITYACGMKLEDQ